MDISIFGPLRPSPTQAGILLRSWLENRSREGFGRMSKCGAGEEGIFCRERFDILQNVEMCELEKEMDKYGSVVFRVGWTTR
jgi:hypothetical protein